MNIVLPAMAVLAAGILTYVLAKAGAKPVLIAVAVCPVSLIFATLLVLQKGELIVPKGNSPKVVEYRSISPAIREEDHRFLDDLFQEQNQDLHRSVLDVAKAQNNSNQVPRAELIVNSSEVKRAQVVVNSRLVKRAEPVQPGRQ